MKAEAAESFEAPLGDVGRIGDVSRHLSSAPLYNIMLNHNDYNINNNKHTNSKKYVRIIIKIVIIIATKTVTRNNIVVILDKILRFITNKLFAYIFIYWTKTISDLAEVLDAPDEQPVVLDPVGVVQPPVRVLVALLRPQLETGPLQLTQQ